MKRSDIKHSTLPAMRLVQLATYGRHNVNTTFGANVDLHTLARNRSALLITDTDDRLMASAAIMGDSSQPVSG